MSDPLARVKRAAQARRRAEEEYRAALVAAVDAGHAYAVLARELDLSRQAVRQLIRRART